MPIPGTLLAIAGGIGFNAGSEGLDQVVATMPGLSVSPAARSAGLPRAAVNGSGRVAGDGRGIDGYIPAISAAPPDPAEPLAAYL